MWNARFWNDRFWALRYWSKPDSGSSPTYPTTASQKNTVLVPGRYRRVTVVGRPRKVD